MNLGKLLSETRQRQLPHSQKHHWGGAIVLKERGVLESEPRKTYRV